MKLPIGIQTFSKIREDNHLYIDKTEEALQIIQNYQYVFLSRPRRFGKSLFLDTLRNIFEGKKEYFKDLYIYDKYDFNDTYPVIKISFDGSLTTKKGIVQTLEVMMLNNQENIDIKCEENLDPANCFKRLLKKSYEKHKKPAVILIDEYDKPMLDNITNKEMADFAKNTLRDFYSVIKGSDEYVKFAFITGVSKFSKVSLFSGLNNLEDITLNPKFGNICGYTQEDIETSFKPLLPEVNLEELKEWYNGYNFLKDRVYNPYDILLFIKNDYVYKNYWFETATPAFLLKLIKKNNYYLPKLENITVGEEILNSFDIDDIDLEVVLFQAGYLTIKEATLNFDNIPEYNLQIPNKEVRISLYKYIIKSLFRDKTNNNRANLFYSLQKANKEEFELSLKTLFASIPYENYSKNTISEYEGFYASVIFAYLSSLSINIQVEQSTNKGRLDMSILIGNNRYIFEFKVGNENALEQIKKMKYFDRYLNENSDIYLVGINFNKKDKNISKFQWEKFKK